MARVKRCGALECDHENPPSEMFCEKCGASLVTAKVTEARELPAEQGPSKDAPPHATEPAIPMPGPVSCSASLSFPWGEEEVGEFLGVGCDPSFSRIWQQCDAYDTVSWRHAELRHRGDKIDIEHLSQSNPTYIDGRALSEGERAEARNGCRIAFSRSLVATVRIE